MCLDIVAELRPVEDCCRPVVLRGDRLVALGCHRRHRPARHGCCRLHQHHCCRLLLGGMLNRRPRRHLGRRVGGDFYPQIGGCCFRVLDGPSDVPDQLPRWA